MVAILLGEGFEETEAIAPYDLLKRAGVDVCFAGVGGLTVKGSHGICVQAECAAEELQADRLEMIVLPGGLRGVQTLSESQAAMELTKQVWQNGAFVAAICAAPTILAKLGITDGRKATCYPGMESKMPGAKMQKKSAVTDGKLITGRAAGSAMNFGLELVKALKGAAAAHKVASDVVYG